MELIMVIGKEYCVYTMMTNACNTVISRTPDYRIFSTKKE